MTSPVWRKSSWTSDGTSNNCVEVAELPSTAVADETTAVTKTRPGNPAK